jgi:hypothetical protein
MLGKRRTFRVKSSSSVKWSTVDQTIKGEGEVLNLSMTGLALLIYQDISLPIGTVLFIEPFDKVSTTLRNTKGKIMWTKKTAEGGIVKFHCGIEFVK